MHNLFSEQKLLWLSHRGNRPIQGRIIFEKEKREGDINIDIDIDIEKEKKEGDIAQYKAVFIGNAAAVISIGAPANLITLLALPYVRLRW